MKFVGFMGFSFRICQYCSLHFLHWQLTPDRPTELAPEKGPALPHRVQVPPVETQLCPGLEENSFTQDKKFPTSCLVSHLCQL